MALVFFFLKHGLGLLCLLRCSFTLFVILLEVLEAFSSCFLKVFVESSEFLVLGVD